jgi:hypothetical protein
MSEVGRAIRLPTCRKSAQSPWPATHAGWKRIHLAHKAEHAVNLETGAVLAVNAATGPDGDINGARIAKKLDVPVSTIRAAVEEAPAPREPYTVLKSNFSCGCFDSNG